MASVMFGALWSWRGRPEAVAIHGTGLLGVAALTAGARRRRPAQVVE